jgi:hypothetical protein
MSQLSNGLAGAVAAEQAGDGPAADRDVDVVES